MNYDIKEIKKKKVRINNMSTLKNKIDFAVVFSGRYANPNGDPLNGNRQERP